MLLKSTDETRVGEKIVEFRQSLWKAKPPLPLTRAVWQPKPILGTKIVTKSLMCLPTRLEFVRAEKSELVIEINRPV